MKIIIAFAFNIDQLIHVLKTNLIRVKSLFANLVFCLLGLIHFCVIIYPHTFINDIYL